MVYFRLTFDGDIFASVSNALFNFQTQKSCITGYDILEVKFDSTMPLVYKIIQLSTKLSVISKFCLGIEGQDCLMITKEGKIKELNEQRL